MKNRRSPLKKSIATRLARLQGGVCFYCGDEPQAIRGRFPTMDHFFPHSRGGSDDESNLVFACQSCDSRKGDRLPTGAEQIRFDDLKTGRRA